MRISIDLDGVVSNFVRQVADMTGLPTTYEPPDWDFSDAFSKDDLKGLFATIRASYNFWEDMPVYTENVQALKKFLSIDGNHEIYYITARAGTKGDNVSTQTLNWLYKNRLCTHPNFYSVIAVDSSSKKRSIIEALNIEMSIDDYGPTVEQCCTILNHRAFLLDRPWNRDKNYGLRMSNLEQFLSLVTGKTPEHNLV